MRIGAVVSDTQRRIVHWTSAPAVVRASGRPEVALHLGVRPVRIDRQFPICAVPMVGRVDRRPADTQNWLEIRGRRGIDAIGVQVLAPVAVSPVVGRHRRVLLVGKLVHRPRQAARRRRRRIAVDERRNVDIRLIADAERGVRPARVVKAGGDPRRR